MTERPEDDAAADDELVATASASTARWVSGKSLVAAICFLPPRIIVAPSSAVALTRPGHGDTASSEAHGLQTVHRPTRRTGPGVTAIKYILGSRSPEFLSLLRIVHHVRTCRSVIGAVGQIEEFRSTPRT